MDKMSVDHKIHKLSDAPDPACIADSAFLCTAIM